MKKSLKFAVVVMLAACACVLFTGCQSPFPQTKSVGLTLNYLKGRNYEFVARNAVGKSEGWRFLFFTQAPTYPAAVRSLYFNAGVPQNGDYELINATSENTYGTDYFFGCFPTIVVTGDIIKLTDTKRR